MVRVELLVFSGFLGDCWDVRDVNLITRFVLDSLHSQKYHKYVAYLTIMFGGHVPCFDQWLSDYRVETAGPPCGFRGPLGAPIV